MCGLVPESWLVLAWLDMLGLVWDWLGLWVVEVGWLVVFLLLKHMPLVG